MANQTTNQKDGSTQKSGEGFQGQRQSDSQRPMGGSDQADQSRSNSSTKRDESKEEIAE